jgi:hypothetical protein
MAKKGSKTTFKSSETVVSSEYLNKLYGGLKGTDSEQYYSSTDPLIGGHVHDGQHLDGHVQKINLAEHVTGKLPIEFLDGTIDASIDAFRNIVVGTKTIVADNSNDTLTFVGGSGIILSANETTDTLTISASVDAGGAGSPNRSFQFNSSDSFAGSETFLFNTSDRSVQLSKEHKFHFGSIDSENSFNIENQVTSTTSILNFSAVNSVDSQFLFKLQDGYGTSIAMELEGSEAFFHTDNIIGSNEGYLGRVSDDDTLFPWNHTNTKELKLWKIDSGSFATSRSVTFKLDNNHNQSYTLTMPEYRPSTSDTLVVVNHDGVGNVTLTWDTFSSGSVGVTDNIQVSDGYGGFQSTDWIISSGNKLRPFNGHYDIGDVASEVNALYINKLGTGSGNEGLYFTDSSDTQASRIYAWNSSMTYETGSSIDIDGQLSYVHFFDSLLSGSRGKNVSLTIGGLTNAFSLRTNRQTFDNQVLELPKTLGSAGQALVIDAVEGSYTMRTKWDNVSSSSTGSLFEADVTVGEDSVSTVGSWDNTVYFSYSGDLYGLISEDSFLENTSFDTLDNDGFKIFHGTAYFSEPLIKVPDTIEITMYATPATFVGPTQDDAISFLKLAHKRSLVTIVNQTDARTLNVNIGAAQVASIAQTIDFERNGVTESVYVNAYAGTVYGYSPSASPQTIVVDPFSSATFKLKLLRVTTSDNYVVGIYNISSS